jgi:hypothetical protein
MVEKRILQPGDIEAVCNDVHREFILGYFNPDPQVTAAAVVWCKFLCNIYLLSII